MRTILLLTAAVFGNVWGGALERSTPEAQGVSSQAVLDFINAAEAQVDALHSYMLVRHGKVIAEGWWSPYNATTPHVLYSLSKSFTSSAIGMAVDEGRLSLDDTVISFFPEETPEHVSDNLKALRIRDLLRMTTGHQFDTTDRITRSGFSAVDLAVQDSEHIGWAAAFLSLPVEFKPGTHFVYNSGATYMLSAILQKATGVTLLDYLSPRLFEPLDIEHPTWETDPQGVSIGGWGLSVTTEDIAKFGQLYLQKGMWQGERLVSEAWVDDATSRQASNGSYPDSDWDQGYGYQFWRSRHNAYRGDGAFGQYCIVLPDQDAVIAITGGVRDMQAVLNLVWRHLLPAMHHEPPAVDATSESRLRLKVAHLALPTVQGSATAKISSNVSGKVYQFEQNDQGIETMTLSLRRGGGTLTLRNAGGEHRIAVGHGAWVNGLTSLTGDQRLVAASGGWTGNQRYIVKLCFYETPYIAQIDFQFNDKKLLFDFAYNVSFGENKWPQLTAMIK